MSKFIYHQCFIADSDIMSETTILSLATSNRASLRTTVPMSIVKQFNLKSGDKLKWAFEVKNNEIIIVVKPMKKAARDSNDAEK